MVLFLNSLAAAKRSQYAGAAPNKCHTWRILARNTSLAYSFEPLFAVSQLTRSFVACTSDATAKREYHNGALTTRLE
jgi:hypothetical protein